MKSPAIDHQRGDAVSNHEQRTWRVRVPASTSNLGSGFDVLGLGLSMYLDLELTTGTGDIEITTTGEGEGALPTDRSNLIAQLILEHAPQLESQGFRVRTHSEIPLTRGFGSSASAIVGAIALAQLATRGTFDRDEILRISTAIEGHPDNVSGSICGGLTISAVIGDQIHTQSIRLPESIRVVTITPDRELSTSAARAALPASYERKDAVFNLQRLGQLISGLYENNIERIAAGLEDRLHQSYRCGLMPAMAEAITRMKAVDGCVGAFVSGAGPAVAAFVTKNEDAVGAAGVAAFEADGISAKYRVVDVDYEGIRERA